MKNSMTTLLITIIFALFAATSCNLVQSDSNPGPSEVQVQMKVQTASTSGTGQLKSSQSLMSYDIQEVKLYIDEMELERVTDDSSDFEDEDFIVNLPLDGSPINLSQNQLPPACTTNLNSR